MAVNDRLCGVMWHVASGVHIGNSKQRLLAVGPTPHTAIDTTIIDDSRRQNFLADTHLRALIAPVPLGWFRVRAAPCIDGLASQYARRAFE